MIKDSQIERDEAIFKIKSNFSKMNLLKDFITRVNIFEPSVFSVDNEPLGVLNSNKFSVRKDTFDSFMLEQKQCFDFM